MCKLRFTRKYKCIYRFYLHVNFLYIEADDGQNGRRHVAYMKIQSFRKYLTVYL